MAAVQSWDDLLQQSQMLVAQGSGGDTQFPLIERSLDQLEVLSRQLKARAMHVDSTAETTAATRLLAREGIDADRLTRDLRSFELKTTFEDVFPVDATSVEEYLQQLHEMTMLSAIQEAQAESLQSFEDHVSHVAEGDWQREKRDFLHSLSRVPSIAPGAASSGMVGITEGGNGFSSTGTPALAYRETPYGARSLLAPSGIGGTVRSKGAGGRGPAMVGGGVPEQNVLDRKIAAYASIVERLNAARESNQGFNVATSFKEAYEMSVGEPAGTRSVTMLKIWRLLQALLGEGGGGGGSSERSRLELDMSRKMQMVIGARRHLEMGHEKYLLDLIQSHASVAGLGGSTGNLQRVRAFLRVRLRDQGPLDFDVKDSQRQPPLDTTWHQIYFCLRSGYYEEARNVAQTSRISRAFAGQLGEWIDRAGAVTPATAAAVAEECERMIRTGERHGKPGYDKKRMLLYVIVSGSRHLGERLLRDVPVLFVTIEDFMWFKLALVRDLSAYDGSGNASGADGRLLSPPPSSSSLMLANGRGGGVPPSPSSSMAVVTTPTSAPDPYTLESLQSYLRQYPDSYYTKNGRDPLVYPYVLLLSLQLHAAIVHLFKDHASEDFRIDAIHIGVALGDIGVLGQGPEVERGQLSLGMMDAVGETASIIRQFGTSFAQAGDLQRALEYCVAAATTMGGGAGSVRGQGTRERPRERQGMLEACLRELLQTYSGIALLLGQGMGGGERQLRRFVEDEGARRALVMAAARECQDRGQYNEAIELYKRAGAFGSALAMVNRKFSEAISVLAMGKMEVEGRASAMRQVGNQILELHKTLGGGPVQDRENIADQHAAFRHLEAIMDFYRLYGIGKYGDAIRELARLPFLPFDGLSVERCAENFRHVARPVEDRLPDVLATAIVCLERMEQSCADVDGTVRSLKIKIANFVANSLPRNWPQSLYELVAQMHATPAR